MRRKIFTLISIAAISFFLTFEGCGGGGGGDGGGDDAPTQTTKTFHLNDDGEMIPGYKISFSMTGTIRYTARINHANFA